MLKQFMDSWPLFQHAYLTAWLSAILLSLMGIFTVARDHIFLGAAVSQAATFGMAVAMLGGELLPGRLGAWLQTDSGLAVLAMGFAVGAALLTAQPSQAGEASPEARTGWLFLGATSGAILLVTHSPHGLAEVQRLLSSSLIGASAGDVWLFGLCVLGALCGLSLSHQRLLVLIMDPALATAIGMRVPLWSVSLTIALGLVVGLSIRVSGLLYTFGCLVLPALVAQNLCREVRPLFLVAPCVALCAGVIGCVVADYTDSPPGQMTVALLCVVLGLAWLWRRWRPR